MDDITCYQDWNNLSGDDKDIETFEEFVGLDDLVEICAPATEEIESSLKSAEHSSDEEEEETSEPIAPPSLKAVVDAVELINQYTLHHGLDLAYEAMSKAQREIIRNACKAKTLQPSIDAIFKKK